MFEQNTTKEGKIVCREIFFSLLLALVTCGQCCFSFSIRYERGLPIRPLTLESTCSGPQDSEKPSLRFGQRWFLWCVRLICQLWVVFGSLLLFRVWTPGIWMLLWLRDFWIVLAFFVLSLGPAWLSFSPCCRLWPWQVLKERIEIGQRSKPCTHWTSQRAFRTDWKNRILRKYPWGFDLWIMCDLGRSVILQGEGGVALHFLFQSQAGILTGASETWRSQPLHFFLASMSFHLKKVLDERMSLREAGLNLSSHLSLQRFGRRKRCLLRPHGWWHRLFGSDAFALCRHLRESKACRDRALGAFWCCS